MERIESRGTSVVLPGIHDAITIPQDSVSMSTTSDSAAVQVRRVALPHLLEHGTLVSISSGFLKVASSNCVEDYLTCNPYS